MNLEAKLSEVRQEYLSRMTRGDISLLQEVEQYITANDGKMLRPYLTLLAAATKGEEVFQSRRTLLLATCVEMLHNVSLLHDDVVDHATTRRSRPSVNHHWGNGVAVLVGDYLLAQTMQLINEIDDRDAAKRINDTVIAMVNSELLNQQVLAGQPLTRDVYLSIIDGKTACLFATAAALGNPEYEQFGLHYGRLFQLRDDIADHEETAFTADLIAAEENLLQQLPQLPMQ